MEFWPLSNISPCNTLSIFSQTIKCKFERGTVTHISPAHTQPAVHWPPSQGQPGTPSPAHSTEEAISDCGASYLGKVTKSTGITETIIAPGKQAVQEETLSYLAIFS